MNVLEKILEEIDKKVDYFEFDRYDFCPECGQRLDLSEVEA